MADDQPTLEAETARANNAVRALQRIVRIMGPVTPPCCEGCAYEWTEALLVGQAALVTDSHFYGTGGGVMVEMLRLDPAFADQLTDARIKRLKNGRAGVMANAEARAHVLAQLGADAGMEIGATQHGPAPEDKPE